MNGEPAAPPQHALVGTWRKTSTEQCAALYPDELEIGPFRYWGRRAPGDTGFTVWDVGSFSVSGTTATLGTATDVPVAYPFQLDGDRLTFADERGCRITYQRLT